MVVVEPEGSCGQAVAAAAVSPHSREGDPSGGAGSPSSASRSFWGGGVAPAAPASSSASLAPSFVVSFSSAWVSPASSVSFFPIGSGMHRRRGSGGEASVERAVETGKKDGAEAAVHGREKECAAASPEGGVALAALSPLLSSPTPSVAVSHALFFFVFLESSSSSPPPPPLGKDKLCRRGGRVLRDPNPRRVD